jgi:hypothetical protein
MTNSTVSTLAFIGGLVAVGLVVFNKVPAKYGILFGSGLVAVGFITKPEGTLS